MILLLVLAATNTFEVPTFLTLLGGILGLVGLLAAATAVLRSATVKSNLELLRGEVADLSASNARLDGENGRMKQELEVLRELVTNRAAVDQLVVAVQSLERSVTSSHQTMLLALTDRKDLPP